MQRKSYLYAALLLLLAADQASATGWPQPKGGGFFKLDFYSIRARRFYGDDGNIYNINGAGTMLGAYTTSFYGEYGLSNRLTAIGYVPFFVRNTVNEGIGAITGEVLQPGLQNNAVGDVDLGLKYHFFRKNAFVMSATLMLGIPSGDYKNSNLLFTGDGEFNQFGRIDWGYGARRWYATGYFGLNNRSKGFSEEFRYFAEAGYWILKNRLLLSAKLNGIESFDNGDPSNSGNGLFSNNVEFTSPQLGLTYEHKGKWGLSVLAAGAMKGRNALAAPAISVGVYAKVN